MSTTTPMYPRSPLMDRRNSLVAATASLLCAPAIVRASSLMQIKVVDWTPVPVPANEICVGGTGRAGGLSDDGSRSENRMDVRTRRFVLRWYF
jgi:hypothetical protein